MTKGKITITFDRGITRTIGLQVAGGLPHLWLAPEWTELVNWWTLRGGNNYYTLAVGDGSAVLLNRDKILNISLTPDTYLEIK